MVLASTLGAYVIGVILGTLLTVLAPGGLRENRVAYEVLGWLREHGPLATVHHPARFSSSP